MNSKIKQLRELENIIPFLAYQRINDEIILVVSSDKLLFSLNLLKRLVNSSMTNIVFNYYALNNNNNI